MKLPRMKMSRPGQLLSMLVGVLILSLFEYFFAPAPTMQPGGLLVISPVALLLHKAFVMWVGATEGLVVDLVVSYYARPGRFKDFADRTMFLHCMHRRSLFMALFAFGMGLAL